MKIDLEPFMIVFGLNSKYLASKNSTVLKNLSSTVFMLLGLTIMILPSTAQSLDQQLCQSKRQEVFKDYSLAEQKLASLTELADAGAVPEIQVKSHREYRDRLLKQLENKSACLSENFKDIDTLIMPRQRFGIITSKTTYEDLVKHFGKARLNNKDFWGAEGQEKFPSTDVNLGADLSFTVVWKDDRRNAPLQVFTTGSNWHTAEGIHVGTTFSELQNILGEFQVSGMEWDYGNQVIINQVRWQKQFDRLSIAIAVGQDTIVKFPEDYRAILGEQTISSSNVHWKKLKPYVSRLALYF